MRTSLYTTAAEIEVKDIKEGKLGEMAVPVEEIAEFPKVVDEQPEKLAEKVQEGTEWDCWESARVCLWARRWHKRATASGKVRQSLCG